MKLSAEQDAALKAVDAWLTASRAPQFFYLAGYAGTGKTTIARHFAQGVKGKVLFGAFTGKAAMVMRSKGCGGASTIHRMIYRVDTSDGVTRFRLNHDSEVKDAALVVLDEVSMVSRELAVDLLSFGTRVLVLGDPAQLPPVNGQAYFTAGEPDAMLTEIHRQALENPIVRLSMDVREGRGLSVGDHGAAKVVRRADLDPEIPRNADQILVGLNRTRTAYNARMRALRGIEVAMPVEGDRLVCLKNNHALGLYNGSCWGVDKVFDVRGDAIEMTVRPLDAGFDNAVIPVEAHPYGFQGREREIPFDERRGKSLFDYGYALTVHKAQGSQWDEVCLFDESAAFREDRARHLYTGITRAAERLTVVV